MEAKSYSTDTTVNCWQDTVIRTNVYNCHNTLEERLAEQAEISFKAGERKVVELIKQTAPGVPLMRKDWQEFLKSEGIE